MSTATAAARQVQGRKAIVRPASAPKPPARLRGPTTGAPVGRPTPSPQAPAPTGAGISATHLYLAEHMVSVLGELASLHETIALLRGEVSALLRAPLSAAGVDGGARALGLLSDAQISAALLQDHSVMIASRLTGLEQRCNPVQQAVALAGLCAAGGVAMGAEQSDATADAIESFNASELPAPRCWRPAPPAHHATMKQDIFATFETDLCQGFSPNAEREAAMSLERWREVFGSWRPCQQGLRGADQQRACPSGLPAVLACSDERCARWQTAPCRKELLRQELARRMARVAEMAAAIFRASGEESDLAVARVLRALPLVVATGEDGGRLREMGDSARLLLADIGARSGDAPEHWIRARDSAQGDVCGQPFRSWLGLKTGDLVGGDKRRFADALEAAARRWGDRLQSPPLLWQAQRDAAMGDAEGVGTSAWVARKTTHELFSALESARLAHELRERIGLPPGPWFSEEACEELEARSLLRIFERTEPHNWHSEETGERVVREFLRALGVPQEKARNFFAYKKGTAADRGSQQGDA